MTSALLLMAALGASQTASPRPVVAVLYFDNTTNRPELDVMRKGLADMLVTDLVSWDGVTVVERARLEEVLGELKLQATKAFDAKTAVQVGKLMGAGYQLTGSMLMNGRELIVDAKLLKTQDGSVALAARAQADQDKIFELEQDLASRIIGAIDAKLTPNTMARRKARVPDLETLLSYSKAIDLSDQGKLAEAQAAMQQVISKAPSFLLARERREELLKKFQEYELRKKELITGSALELGKLIDRALADEAALDTMDRKAAGRFLAMRLLKGRFILRSAKQLFSSRDPNFRVALRGQEAKALLAMRGWLENERRFAAELSRTQKRLPGLGEGELEPAVERLVADAKLAETSFGRLSLGDPWLEGVTFVLHGSANDGERFSVAPALGFVDPAERKAVLAELDQRIDAAFAAARADPKQQTWPLNNLLRERTRACLQLYDVDGAVSVLQRFLDTFPTASQASDYERDIKDWLSGRRIDGFDKVERWSRGLKGCEGMDLNIGSDSVRDRIEQAGTAGVLAMAAELEKACPRSPKLDSYFSTIYKGWARDLAQAEDCDGYRALMAKYVAVGGSPRDMLLGEKNSGCSLGEVKKNVAWFHSRRDQNWDAEFTDELASSFDGKVLTLSGKSWLGTPHGRRRQGLDLRAERQADGSFSCVGATNLRYDGQKTDGTCTVTVTSLAARPGEFDEGTFAATFIEPWDGYKKKAELTEGFFKLKRR